MTLPRSEIVALARGRRITNALVAKTFEVSPATAHRWLAALVAEGVIVPIGAGRAAAYELPPIELRYRLKGLDEAEVWKELNAELEAIEALTDHERRTLAYSVTEMVNNAIDHSRGRSVIVSAMLKLAGLEIRIQDDGIGVYRHLEETLGWRPPHLAIVQLEKGKITTAPEAHTGEGLFFTSKAVTRFRLESDCVAWIVDNVVEESAIGTTDVKKGTLVRLELEHGRVPKLEDVFARYTDPETQRFSRSRTTVALAKIGTVFMSRSEAKRVVNGLERFDEVEIDFAGVDAVGQGFCDEVFRVYAKAHPEVALIPIRMNAAVAFMVGRARATAARE